MEEYQISQVMRKLNNHYFITGGYRYNVTREWDVEGSTFFKIVRAAPVQMDLTVRGTWRKTAWGGVSWRTGDAIAILGGYNYSDMLYIGYSYDITTSQLRRFQTGTHEIMVGVRFNSIKNTGTQRRKIR
jgi:type IX secretion system PorP/SprF family membrane protein